MDLARVLEKKIAPKAEKIDQEPKALWKGFRQLGKRNLLAQVHSAIREQGAPLITLRAARAGRCSLECFDEREQDIRRWNFYG